jgi:hypothetical protein
MIDLIKAKLKGENRPSTTLIEHSAANNLISKIRDIDKNTKRRDLMSDKQYQTLIDDFFHEYGVVIQINTVDSKKEIITRAGSPLKSGNVEYLKTTPAYYDHFIIYNSLNFRNDKGFDNLAKVCENFGLHFNDKASQVTKLMQNSKIPLVAEMFAKGFRHGEKTGKGIILPFEVLGIHKDYDKEGELLYSLATKVYHVDMF